MDIYKKLPTDLQIKFFTYFQHPLTTLLKKKWKLHQIQKKNHVIAQLNRYNYFRYSSNSHHILNNSGANIIIQIWLNNQEQNNTLLFTLTAFHCFDYEIPLTLPINNHFINPNWKTIIQKRLFGINSDDKWIRRSLYGGIYPINRRPRYHIPNKILHNRGK